MDEVEFLSGYFEWLWHLTSANTPEEKGFLFLLFSKQFRYSHPLDKNREDNGLYLRYRYLDNLPIHVDADIFIRAFPSQNCSVLEMMVALALRLEEEYLFNPSVGPRTARWFWEMCESMHISPNSSSDEVNYRLDIFLDRGYAPDGNGGLFTIRNPYQDLRTVEIWTQAMWWVDQKLQLSY